MLHEVHVGTQRVSGYEDDCSPGTVETLKELAGPLRGLRVLHLSATPYGGGVAEILRSEIPLLRDLGLAADWQIITGDDEFFAVTKIIHNALQGATGALTSHQRDEYLHHASENAALLEADDYDVIVVHDPQPLPIPAMLTRDNRSWVWRCHIDTSEPNPDAWTFLQPFVQSYDAAVFTLGSFVPRAFPLGRVEIIPPAIDPKSPKNLALPTGIAKPVLDWIGVDFTRPLIAQVSRFDPWKDPLGVITAYRLIKSQVHDVQLVLAGSMALDDPQGWDVYRAIQNEAHGDPDIHVFTNFTGVGNIEVNALQQLADVIVQKSIREGFGLVVSEALWKRTPVVAGHAGGIPIQLRDGAGGFLVESVEECADRASQLLRDASLRRSLGDSGHMLVRERFVLPRLLADELRVYASTLGPLPKATLTGIAGLVDERRDPVCGMRLTIPNGSEVSVDGHTFGFCSQTCASEFTAAPHRYLGEGGTPRGSRRPAQY